MEVKLLDHVLLNNRLFANFACNYSEDGKISLLLESGVCVLTLKGYLDSIFPRFSFKKDFILLSNTSIAENLDIHVPSFTNDLSRQNLFETILNSNLSGNAISSTKIPSRPVYAMWSPRGIVDKTDGALAVLTSLHNIEVYVEIIDENEISSFTCVANFAKDISEYYRRSWKAVEGLSAEQKLSELKRRSVLVTPTAFSWSHVVLKDRKACCILFVGHQDGSITAWRFVERKAVEAYESRLQLLERYNTRLKQITSIHWFCRKSDAGSLSVGDVNGHISTLCVSKLSTDSVKFSDEVVFSEDDDLKVDKISVLNYQNITYLILTKQKYFQVYAINEFGEVFAGKLIEVGNLYIAGVVHYEKNLLLILSVCGQFKQIGLSLVNKEIVVSEKIITLDFDTNKYKMHGILISPNKVFLAILAYPSQFKEVAKAKHSVHFFILQNKMKDPFQMLMDISAPTIRDYWDCFETLRVSCLQEKVFPWRDKFPNLNYDALPLLKLKILRWISKLSEKVYSTIGRVEEYPIKACILLTYMVDIKLAVQRMTNLLNIHFSEKKLTLFQMQSLDLLNFFLKEMIVTEVLPKANLGEVFIDEIYNVMRIANELQYPPMPQCLWCGEKIIGTMCIPYHADSRCAISLMPLHITPGYKCPFCKCVVSKEMDKEYFPIFCPYCDIPMKRRLFEKKSKKSDDASEATKLEDMVTSECRADCCKDEVHLSDVEENEVSYVVLTDSEEENEKDVYSKIRALALTVSTEQSEAKADSQSNPGKTDESRNSEDEAEVVDSESEQLLDVEENEGDEDYEPNEEFSD